MKKLILILIGIFTIATISATDLVDKVIKLLNDYKEVKQEVVTGAEQVIATADSLRTYCMNDTTFQKTMKKIQSINNKQEN